MRSGGGCVILRATDWESAFMSGGLGGPAQLNHALTRIYKGTLRHQPEGPKNMVEGRVQSFFLEEKLKPIFSIDPVYDAVLRNGGGGILPPVNQRILQCMTTVLAQVSVGNGSSMGEVFSDILIKGQRFAGPMTLRQFMGLDGMGQMAVIDAGWNRICTKKAYDKFSFMMWDPRCLSAIAARRGCPMPSRVSAWAFVATAQGTIASATSSACCATA
jgi:hypothetical protein